MATYSVEEYRGDRRVRREDYRSLEDAYRDLRGLPDSSLSVITRTGWVVADFYFSPKHPPPSLETLRKMIVARMRKRAGRSRTRF